MKGHARPTSSGRASLLRRLSRGWLGQAPSDAEEVLLRRARVMTRYVLLERKDGGFEQVAWKGGNWGAVEHAQAELRRGRAVSAQVRETDGRLVWFSEGGT